MIVSCVVGMLSIRQTRLQLFNAPFTLTMELLVGRWWRECASEKEDGLKHLMAMSSWASPIGNVCEQCRVKEGLSRLTKET